MKILLALSLVLLTAAQAEACMYAPIRVRPDISAAQRAELAKDQQIINQLRTEMNTICTAVKNVAVNSCDIDKGMCQDLPPDVADKFRYESGADGSRYGMVSPEDRSKNAAIIDGIYKKWSAI